MDKPKIITPFKMQVLTNFPFIEADFDALTNYELLCKIVEKLNEVVGNENALTSYVNNYFDNLDVQEEINRKLDAMALDGSLEALLLPVCNAILNDEKLDEIVEDIWGETLTEMISNATSLDTLIVDDDAFSWRQLTGGTYAYSLDMVLSNIPITVNSLESAINDILSNGLESKRYLITGENDGQYYYGNSYVTIKKPVIDNDSYRVDCYIDYDIFHIINTSYSSITCPMRKLYNEFYVTCSISDNSVTEITEITNIAGGVRSYYMGVNTDYEILASEALVGGMFQYVGETTASFKKGHFYECIDNGDNTYSWSEISFSEPTPNEIGEAIVSDTFLTYNTISNTLLMNLTTSDEINFLINATNNLIENNIDSKRYNLYTLDNSKKSNGKFGNSYIIINKPTDVTDGQHYIDIYLHYDIYALRSITNNSYLLQNYNRSIGIIVYPEATFSDGLVTAIASGNTSASGVRNLPFLTPTNNETYDVLTDYQPTHKKYVDEAVAKYTSMPSASVTLLGNVVQYIGATDSTYTKGHFYECIDNGDNTYSWSEISFGGGSISHYPIYQMDGTDTTFKAINIGALSNTQKEDLLSIINSAITNNETNFLLIVTFPRTQYKYDCIMYLCSYYIKDVSTLLLKISFVASNDSSSTEYLYARYSSIAKLYFKTSVTLTNGVATSIGNISGEKTSMLLYTDNGEAFTPSAGSYQPATAKYCEDLPTTYNGYDATKTQVLKNVNGVLTWIDEV